MDWVTTSTILRDLRDYENQTAWQSFVERFRDPLVRFAASQGVPAAQVQDVVQDTLAAFAESLRLGRYDRERGRLRSWLFGIALKQVLKERRRLFTREKAVGGAAEIEHAAGAIPDERAAEDHWNRHWDRFIAQSCMGQVRREFSHEQVHVFELIVREERTPAEVAGETGLPVKAVYNVKHRILTRMRELRAGLEDVE